MAHSLSSAVLPAAPSRCIQNTFISSVLPPVDSFTTCATAPIQSRCPTDVNVLRQENKHTPPKTPKTKQKDFSRKDNAPVQLKCFSFNDPFVILWFTHPFPSHSSQQTSLLGSSFSLKEALRSKGSVGCRQHHHWMEKFVVKSLPGSLGKCDFENKIIF